jgi:hypothetical protein
MRLDGARSATRKEQEGGTCATRVTRGTIDFQGRDNFELRDKEFARNFHVAFQVRSAGPLLLYRLTTIIHYLW